MKLNEIGEKKLVRDLTSLYTPNPCLVGGFGHDSAILDIALSSDEYLLMNTDRSGMNIAYKLGLADASCVGDFAVSHAVSDISRTFLEIIGLSHPAVSDQAKKCADGQPY